MSTTSTDDMRQHFEPDGSPARPPVGDVGAHCAPASGSAAYLSQDHGRALREAAETIAWMSDTLRMAYLHALDEAAYSQADHPPRLSPAEEKELGRRLAEHWHVGEYWRARRQNAPVDRTPQ
jgi:hypothetical protein